MLTKYKNPYNLNSLKHFLYYNTSAYLSTIVHKI